MSSKVHCYLRTLRHEWGLTQEELASLLPKGDRNRVYRVERAIAQPNAGEILAYSLIFGVPARRIFRRFAEDTDEAVMQGAYKLYKRVERRSTPKDVRKRELLDHLRDRAVKSAHRIDL